MYLLGTIHAGVGLKDYPTYLTDAVTQADIIAIESNTYTTLNSLERLKLSYKMLRFSGPKLSDELSPEAWQKLYTRVGPTIDPSEFNPSALNWLSYGTVCVLWQLSSKSKNALDLEIETYAKQNREVWYLEESDYDLFSEAFNTCNSAKDVENTIAETPEQLVNKFVEGDMSFLEKLYSDSYSEHPRTTQVLVVRRNLRWMSRILEIYSQAERPFIAVGAIHLVGPDGLLALLKKEGFQVRRIEN
jgi:uncharacterized protein YbaP (TraB family)